MGVRQILVSCATHVRAVLIQDIEVQFLGSPPINKVLYMSIIIEIIKKRIEELEENIEELKLYQNIDYPDSQQYYEYIGRHAELILLLENL